MFTGIIKEIGKIKNIRRRKDHFEIDILCSEVAGGISLGDSVAVNGVCLSVVKIGNVLSFDVIGNTFSQTNLKRLGPGDAVNLENALRAGDSISGHMVSGHVDGERVIKESKKTSKGWLLDIALKPGDEDCLVNKGSIAVDGISLTVSEVLARSVRIFIIPHTLENTTLSSKKRGDYVNIEFDSLIKYAKNNSNNITMDLLRDKGFA